MRKPNQLKDNDAIDANYDLAQLACKAGRTEEIGAMRHILTCALFMTWIVGCEGKGGPGTRTSMSGGGIGAAKTGGIPSKTGGSGTGGGLAGTGGLGTGGVLLGSGGSQTVGGNSGGLTGAGGVQLGGSGTGGVVTGGALSRTGGLGAGGTTISSPQTNTGGDTGSGLNGDAILNSANFKHYVDKFNTMENEPIVKAVPNSKAWDWMLKNIPFFECSNPTIERIYYYRWWTYRKHIIQEPTGRTLSEFITWEHANSSAYGHHLAEGRWLHDSSLLDEYTHYWYRHGFEEKLHRYSQWSIEALYRRYLVTLDKEFIVDLLDDLIKDYRRWEDEKKLSSGLFWQYDVRDAMEESISGSREAKNVRPTINSYMAANAWALAQIATLAGRADVAEKYQSTYKLLREKMIQAMWDAEAKFFKVQFENGTLSDAREAIGFIPWKFNLPGPEHVDAWLQIRDPKGFLAPRGLTTAERRHPKFRSHGVGTCEWDGAVWPFATSQTLDGLANVLRSEGPKPVDSSDYFNALVTYADSHQKNGLPYIGEYMDEITGVWLKGDSERSRWYNHSTFCDLVINGLVGIVPRGDKIVEIHPLVPAESLDWFALDYVRYHGYRLTVLWDKDGSRYRRGVGLRVYTDGQLIAQASTLTPVTGNLSGKASQ